MNSITTQIKPGHILFCRCGGERIDSGLLAGVEDLLKNQPVAVTCLSDLCGLVATNRQLVAELFSNEVSDYLIIACYRRTLDLLLGQVINDAKKSVDYELINLVGSNPGEVFGKISKFGSGHAGKASFTQVNADPGWPAWYPVIDYQRCTECGQCADFCLFGVYEKPGKRVTVTNPQGCKNNCPACARICPATAIIFPKYKNGGAVGGSDEIDEHAEQKRQSVDIEGFLGSDIYTALEKRKLKRKSIIREEAIRKALSERDDALKGIN